MADDSGSDPDTDATGPGADAPADSDPPDGADSPADVDASADVDAPADADAPGGIDFELLGVRGGWDQARFGPTDQVEYVARAGDRSLESYGSVHTFLRLYDLARLERPDHPKHLGVEVTERGGPDPPADPPVEAPVEIAVGLHGLTAETTYAGLRAALEPFLAEVFAELDAQTPEGREEYVAAMAEAGVTLSGVDAVYDRVLDG